MRSLVLVTIRGSVDILATVALEAEISSSGGNQKPATESSEKVEGVLYRLEYETRGTCGNSQASDKGGGIWKINM